LFQVAQQIHESFGKHWKTQIEDVEGIYKGLEEISVLHRFVDAQVATMKCHMPLPYAPYA